MATTNDTVYVEIIAKTQQAVQGIASLAKAFAASYLTIKAFKELIIGSVQEYLKAEAATKKLQAAMMGLGNTSKASLKGMTDLASQLQKTTRFADDVTTSAMAMLMSVGGMTTKMAADMTPAVQDFAEAMGMDLESAATLVAKAVEGNVGALSRYGIKIEEGLDKQGRMAALTRELGEKFGGLAQAMGETASGALARLNNAFSDMKEEIGRAVMTSVAPLVDWLAKVAGKIADVMKAANDLKEALRAESLGMADTTDKLIIANAAWAEARRNLDLIEQAAGDEAAQITAMNKATAAGYDSITAWKKALEETILVERRRANVLEGQVKREKEAAEAAEEKARKQREWLEKLAIAYAKTPEAQQSALADEIKYWENALLTAGTNADKIIAILKMLRDEYAKAYPALTVQAPIWRGAPTPGGVQRAEEEAGELGGASGRRGSYVNAERSVGRYARTLYTLADAMEDARVAEEAILLPTHRYGAITDDAADSVKKLEEELKELSDNLGEALEGMASEALVGFFTAIGDAASGAVSLGEAMRKMLADMATKIGQMMVEAGLQIIIANAYNPAMVGIGLALIAAGGLSIIGGTVLGNTGGSGGGVELPRMATGGIVTKPTVAMIGEAGPEAIVPLGRGGAGGGVNIYVNGSIWQTEDLARAVAGVMSRW